MPNSSFVIAGFGKQYNGVPRLNVLHHASTGRPIVFGRELDLRFTMLPVVSDMAATYKVNGDYLTRVYVSPLCKASTPETISLSPSWSRSLNSSIRAIPMKAYQLPTVIQCELDSIRLRWNCHGWLPKANPGTRVYGLPFVEESAVDVLRYQTQNGVEVNSVSLIDGMEVVLNAGKSELHFRFEPNNHVMMFSMRLYHRMLRYVLSDAWSVSHWIGDTVLTVTVTTPAEACIAPALHVIRHFGPMLQSTAVQNFECLYRR